MYTHITSTEIKTLENFSNDQRYVKPKGLWISKNNDWEEFVGEKLTYDVELNDSKILVVNMHIETELMDFIETYRRDNEKTFIDWLKITKDYDGIWFEGVSKMPEIYFTKEKFLNAGNAWVLTFDIDSGCIWNCDKVAITKREKNEI